jgi:formylmethanofuran dehydrogenase subunit C
VSALTFTLRERPAQRIDLSRLIPDHLKALSRTEIAELPLWIGNRQYTVGDLFEISGNDTRTLLFANACNRLDHIGAEMSSGAITIQGDAGAFTGRAMQGGRIHVYGSAGAFSGAMMADGYLQIDGNAGDFTAGVLPGDRVGMRGGMILIKGNAGERTGDRLRRGTILIEGSVGDFCGSNMIAGTIAVLDRVGTGIGLGMRRGTLICTRMPAGIPLTFNDNGVHDLGFLRVMQKSFKDLDSRFASWPGSTRAHRFSGDLACAGLGEILVMS